MRKMLGILGGFLALTLCGSEALPGTKSPEPKPQQQITGVKCGPYYSVANAKEIKSKATGFFRVEQQKDGRWWFIDPEGNGFVYVGIDHCNYRGHFAWKLGYYLYRKNNDGKYKSHDEWADETAQRLRKWGFNALGSTCDNHLLMPRGFVSNQLLRMSESFAKKGGERYIAPHLKKTSTVFPNVFHPDFAKHCEEIAQEYCAPNKNNPWYIGYYIDNELAWWGRSARHRPVGIFNLVMAMPPTHSAKVALRNFLEKDFNGSVEKFNSCWGTKIASFDDILNLESLPDTEQAQVDVKERFLGLIAEIYFRTTTTAIRKADPNHLVLGSRFANIGGAVSPLVWKAAGKYCDIVTFNCYPHAQLDENCIYDNVHFKGETIEKSFDRLYELVKRPILITEWSFPAIDGGVPCTRGAGQRFMTQKERTQATKLFAQTVLTRKYILGYDYFMWVDEPAGGITEAFPENCNYGLVNADGVAYKLITEMFTELHSNVVKYRSMPLPPRRKLSKPLLRSAIYAAKVVKGEGRAEFKMTDKKYTLSNSKITLEGSLDSTLAFDKIIRNGESVSSGNLYPMVGVIDKTGVQYWWKPRKVVKVTGRNLADGSAVAEILVQGWRWQGRFRVVLPAGSNIFFTEPVMLRNLDKDDLVFNGFYFCLYGEKSYGPGDPVAPFLWNYAPQGCWVDPSGNYVGSVAALGSDYRIKFFLNPKRNTLHADAKLDLPGDGITLAPGDQWRAKKGFGAMAHIIGTGGSAGFMKAASECARVLRIK